MNVFVTGASGFIGSHLVDQLLARGDIVFVLQRKRSAATARLTQERLRFVEGDVLNADLIKRIVVENGLNEIYHLAAQSFPGLSWEQPGLTHQVNVQGTLNVLDAVRAASDKPALVVASSSAIYAPSDMPICESGRCQPLSPYGVSKLAADHLAHLYAARYGLRVMQARPFFLLGSRKTGDVSSDWARQIVAIERGSTPELLIGNVDCIRDFLHVYDGVNALMTIASKGEAGQAYNISSGTGWSLSEVLKTLTAAARVKIPVRVDPNKLRPLDERIKIGDSSKLQSLGWKMQRSVPEALQEILNYWREQP